MQVMGLAPSQPEAWGVTEEEVQNGTYSKNPEYKKRKALYRDTLLAMAERVFPELRHQLAFEEVATPLTHRRFVASTGGTSYGIAATVAQNMWRRPGQETHVPGLYLCGASTSTGHGISPVTLSGIFAAKLVDKSAADLVLQGRGLGPSVQAAEAPPSSRRNAAAE